MSRLLAVESLRVDDGHGRELLAPLSFTLDRGHCLGIVGESGSGKSLTALALCGLLPEPLRASGRLHLHDDIPDVDGTTSTFDLAGDLASLRGSGIALVFQDALASLHPLRTVGSQLRETLRVRRGMSRTNADAEAASLLARMQLPVDVLSKLPHQISGGQRQRVLLALALATQPRLLIADESTSALDPLVQAEVIGLLRREVLGRGIGLVFIGHDLSVVASLADQLAVFHRGRLIEQGAAKQVLTAPSQAYTRQLIDATQLPQARAAAESGNALLSLRNLRVRYPRADRDALQLDALSIDRGEALALVGESGSGKSTLAKALLRLLPAGEDAQIMLDGVRWDHLSGAALRQARRRVQCVFQDPYASLDPRQRIARLLAEPRRIHGLSTDHEALVRLLAAVDLDADALTRYPHAFSGGQRQRIAIARALAAEPDLLIADEAVSALDARVRGDVLALLNRLKTDRGLSLLFITHDMDAAAAVADRIAVMKDGRMVECAAASVLLASPAHGYSRALLAARPASLRSAVV
ncbi:MAG: ABC transporter ATP-binding protein [Lysobacteraceae bacterium]